MSLNNKVKAALLLSIFTIIVYSNSLGGEFLYDDDYFIVKNINIRSFENIPSFFTSPSAAAFAELAQDVYRPLTTISFALDYRRWGLNTFGYHLENVVLHALNVVLLFILLQLIFGNSVVPPPNAPAFRSGIGGAGCRNERKEFRVGSIAFLASLLFACHPVQTEAVAWISSRSSVLFLFFYLGAFILYLLFMKAGKKRYLAFSLVLFTASLFSKEMAISLPLLLVLYDIHFAGRESIKRRVLKFAPYFLLSAFFVAVRFLVINRVSQCPWWGGGPYDTFLTMLVALCDYIKILALPIKLSAYYVTTVYSSIAEPRVLMSAAAIAALIAALPFIFRRSRRTSFAICLFFAALLPVSNIVPLRAIMAERFLYLPSIGFCMLLAILLGKYAISAGAVNRSKAGRFAVAIAAILVLLYSVRTMMRNEDWKSQVAVTNSILKINPLNPWGLATLGAAYSDRGQYEAAIKPLLKAIVLSEGYFAPRNILGFCYVGLGRYDEAIAVLAKALEIRPDNLEALSSMGVAYAETKRYPEAIRQFERAIKVDPSFVDGYMNLATTYDQMGEHEKAIRIYETAVANTRSAQSIAIAYVRVGDIYMRLKNPETAREYYERAMALCGRGMEELKRVVAGRLSQ
ncbi:MAG: tetratricopeptide repeat protein [Candidatus Omnitrophica bacterium]|nr:tetratricopeptide repeat protein [Candidatus Omnitrophota bacterium]